MDLTSIPLMQGFRQRLDWIAQNQSVIAGNIANADTANYKAREIEPFNLGMAQSHKIGLRTTNSRHISTSNGGGLGHESRIRNSQTQYEISPDGNNVILEEQMIAAANNAMQHQIVSNLYQKNINMLKMVMQKS